MTLTIIAELVPLKTNPNGVVYVGGTRVTLDTIVAVFKQGATPEEIVHRYPSLRLGDVYASIAFFLNHQQEIEEYLQQRQQQAQEIRQINEARFDPQSLRDRLLARRACRYCFNQAIAYQKKNGKTSKLKEKSSLKPLEKC